MSIERTAPTGWDITKLEDVVDILDSKRVPINAKERETRVGQIPYYGATGQVGWIDDYLFDEELVLLGEDGAPFLEAAKQKAYLIRGKSWVNNHAHVLKARNDIPNAYLKYYLDTVDYHEFVTGTTRLKLNQAAMRRIPVPLAPPEQRNRIVAEIEKQFSRLDEAVANLKRVKANLKRYKAAVLKAAVEGKLTEDWRKQHPNFEPASKLLERILAERKARWNGKGRYKQPAEPDISDASQIPAGWMWVSLDQISSHITSGSRDWSQFYGKGTGTFVLAQNVRPMRLDFTERQGVDAPRGDAETERTRLQADDLLVTIVGAKTGDVCRVPTEVVDHFVCQSVALLRPVCRTCARFFELYLASPENGQAQWKRYMYGQGRPHLSFEQLKMTAVPLPPLDEQEQIVAEVERRLSVIDELEATVEANLARADRLRQSILSQAFNGKLLSNGARG